MVPTHQYRDQNNHWKPCVIFAMNSQVPEELEMRDVETSETYSVGKARMRAYDPEEQNKMPEPNTNGSTKPNEEQEEQEDQDNILPDNSHNKNKKKPDEVNAAEDSDKKESSEPEVQVQKKNNPVNSLDKVTQAIILRNVQIYKPLEAMKAFKLIYDASVISANNEAHKNEDSNKTNNSINDCNDSYTKRLYQETTTRPFTEKYQINEQEYYKYSAIISTKTNEHNEMPESRLLEEVMKKCTDSERRRWNRWKKNKAIDILQNSNDNETKHQRLQSLNAFKYYEALII